MSTLGFVPFTTTAAPPLSAGQKKEPGFQVQDLLASARRLWLRGRLPAPPPQRATVNGRSWWRRKPLPPGEAVIPHVRIETEVSGHVLRAEVPLQKDGTFEALYTADLPPARRGWRVARNRLFLEGQESCACALVLCPAGTATDAVVVILPLAFTFETGAAQQWVTSDAAARLAASLRWLETEGGTNRPLYYVACIPDDTPDRQAELALAATSLGWPGGHFVVLPTSQRQVRPTLTQGLDRLRWLFAGERAVLVWNLEPEVAETMRTATAPNEDRASVSRFVDHGERPEPVSCPAPAVSIRSARPTGGTRYPVVFCHGMLAMSTLRMQLPKDLNCFSVLGGFLRQRGHHALFPQVAPTSGVRVRAEQLKEQILRWTDEPVNLIAHSMGGLDCRYLITQLGMAGRIRSLTTVSTPHRGTYLADWFHAHFRQRIPLLLAMEALGVNVDGFRDCRVEPCQEFNATTPDAPGVTYFSYGAEVTPARLTPALRRAWSLLTPVEGPNDGMVSLTSARWGEYLGTLHVDHFAQTPDGNFVRPGENFDSLGFFSRIVEELAWRGF